MTCEGWDRASQNDSDGQTHRAHPALRGQAPTGDDQREANCWREHESPCVGAQRETGTETEQQNPRWRAQSARAESEISGGEYKERLRRLEADIGVGPKHGAENRGCGPESSSPWADERGRPTKKERA